MPAGTVNAEYMRNSPSEDVRRMFQTSVVDKGGLYDTSRGIPESVMRDVELGLAASLDTDSCNVALSHFQRLAAERFFGFHTGPYFQVGLLRLRRRNSTKGQLNSYDNWITRQNSFATSR